MNRAAGTVHRSDDHRSCPTVGLVTISESTGSQQPPHSCLVEEGDVTVLGPKQITPPSFSGTEMSGPSDPASMVPSGTAFEPDSGSVVLGTSQQLPPDSNENNNLLPSMRTAMMDDPPAVAAASSMSRQQQPQQQVVPIAAEEIGASTSEISGAERAVALEAMEQGDEVARSQMDTEVVPSSSSSTVATTAAAVPPTSGSGPASTRAGGSYSSVTEILLAGSSGSGLQPLRDSSHYEELSVIGNGAYGTVYRARDRASDTIVALKKMRFSLTEDGVPMAILREISLLKQLEKFDHPNIVRLLDICHGQRREREMSLYLVFEHVHQDLASYLDKCPPPGLGQDRIKDIIWQILSGVDFLHSHRIVHRDLKPQNLLVTRDGVVKLTDFGLARIYEFYTLLTSVVVTLWYRSPEVLMGLSYATPVDIWSCGCIFAELYLRKALFPGQYEMDQLSRIFDTIGLPNEQEWPERAAVTRNNFRSCPPRDWSDLVPEMDPSAKDLIQKMLCFAPNRRITANHALKHPYFSEYSFAHVTSSPDTSGSSRSMRSSDQSDRSLDSSLTFSSHDESAGSLDLSGSYSGRP